MIVAAIIMITGFIITIRFKNPDHTTNTGQYVGMGFGIVGLVLWLFAKNKE